VGTESVALIRSAPASEIPRSSSRVPIDKPVRHHGTVHVIASRCKECEFCVVFCPEEMLEISDRYTSRGYRPARVKEGKEGDCIACRFCEDVCPEYAIYVVEDPP
jgi:2-oxoglutarate ferredoxin oxidoreductase subunit delta